MLFSSCQSIETSFGNKKENLDDILDDISSKYRVLNYTSDNTSIFMEVEDTENVNDVRKELNNRLSENNIKNYKVKVKEVNYEKSILEGKLTKVSSSLQRFLDNKGYEDVIVSYSTKNEPMITVTTPINSRDEKEENYKTTINKEIYDFLRKEKIENIIKSNQYNVQIFSKDKTLIN